MFQPASTVIVEPSPKYYWLLYQLRNGNKIGICTTSHPFVYVDHVNKNEQGQKWGRITLIDWKNITAEEFSLWVEINPLLAESVDIRDIHQMD